jgi:hypothetical protein
LAASVGGFAILKQSKTGLNMKQKRELKSSLFLLDLSVYELNDKYCKKWDKHAGRVYQNWLRNTYFIPLQMAKQHITG